MLIEVEHVCVLIALVVQFVSTKFDWTDFLIYAEKISELQAK